MSTPTQAQKPDTAGLLEQQKAHEKQKADHIAALLQERADIAEAHDKRQNEIASDLMMLGYKKPRAPRVKKTAE